MSNTFELKNVLLAIGGCAVLVSVIISHFRKKRGLITIKKKTLSPKQLKLITKGLDIFLVCVICFWLFAAIFQFVIGLLFIANPIEDDPFNAESLSLAFSPLLIFFVISSGFLGALIGGLSFFQKNLTKAKRLFLLFLCILPAIFMILAIFIKAGETRWTLLKASLNSALFCWIINAPSVFIGKPFFEVMAPLINKLNTFLWPSEPYSQKKDNS